MMLNKRITSYLFAAVLTVSGCADGPTAEPPAFFGAMQAEAQREPEADLDEAFSLNFASGKWASASNTRAGELMFTPENVMDNDLETYWATDDSVSSAHVNLSFGGPVETNAVIIQEYIALGQRVQSFEVQSQNRDLSYTTIASGTTIGNRRTVQFDRVRTRALRITFDGQASLVISNIKVYNTPDLEPGKPEDL
jgi:alpha-L-fucosidase